MPIVASAVSLVASLAFIPFMVQKAKAEAFIAEVQGAQIESPQEDATT